MRAGGPVPISADTWTFASTTTLMLRSTDQNVDWDATSVVLALHGPPWSRQLRAPSPLPPTDRRYGLHCAASLRSRLDAVLPKLLSARCRLPWRFDATMRRRQLRDQLLGEGWRSARRHVRPLPEAHRVLRCVRLACFRSPRHHRRRGCRPRRYGFRDSSGRQCLRGVRTGIALSRVSAASAEANAVYITDPPSPGSRHCGFMQPCDWRNCAGRARLWDAPRSRRRLPS